MTHQSSRSQGKGSRRWPGRPGGARKKRRPEWATRAAHLVALSDLPAPVVSLRYTKPWGKDAAESIYLFDQEAAKVGLAYHAEYVALSSRWFAFLIRVSERDAEAAREIIERLNPTRPRRAGRVAGWWTDIEPMRLSKADRGHPWKFAAYRESSSQREDGLSYTAFLFRNDDRTAFGLREWLGYDVLVSNDLLEKMAHRVVTDTAFRHGLLSDDPDLTLLWKKR